jgi:transcriptional antiterminator RfaH
MSATIWYVAYTNPKCEQRAAAALRRVGFETFLPIISAQVRRRHKRVTVGRVLFPRYLFVGYQPVCTWFDFRNADGVEAVLANDGKPIAVDASIIAELQTALREGAFEERKPAEVTAGSRVRLTEGPFYGFEGTCSAVHSNRNVEVIINLFNRPTSVKMALDQLMNLGPCSASGQPAVQASIR